MNWDRPTLELTCRSGHISKHQRDRVIRRNDAWCPKCGAGIDHAGADTGGVPKAA
jgi:hypothetical protein